MNYKPVYSALDGYKIKINRNKNPIKMDIFLPFLTVPVARSYDHLGSDNGWTQLVNEKLQLIVSGGVVGGVEYLDNLQFGKKIANPYNNYVNPFYLWGILTKAGRTFFIDYYSKEISEIIEKSSNKIVVLKKQLLQAEKDNVKLLDGFDILKSEATCLSNK